MILIADESCRGMEPEIRPGDKLEIEKKQEVENNDIALLCLDGEMKLRKVKSVPSGIWLCAENPAIAPEFIADEEAARVQILGKVVQVTRKYA